MYQLVASIWPYVNAEPNASLGDTRDIAHHVMRRAAQLGWRRLYGNTYPAGPAEIVP